MTPSSELERLVGAGFYESHATFPGFVILAFILFCDGGKNKGRFIKAERAFVVFVAFFPRLELHLQEMAEINAAKG